MSQSNQDPLSESSHRKCRGDGLEVAVRQHDDDSDASAEGCEFNGCIGTLVVTELTPNYDRAHLGVVRCTLAQLEQVID